MSKGGYIGTLSETFDEGPPIYFSHSDIVWSAAHDNVRLGMGALRRMIEILFKDLTKGKELEIMFRPTRGLSFVMNVSEQKSVRSNTGAVTRALIFDTPTSSGAPLATEWRNDWTYQIPLSQAAIQLLGSRADINMFGVAFQRNVLNPYNIAASADGAAVHELRRWRANFVGNYEFQGEALKGFGVGTGPMAGFKTSGPPAPSAAI